MNLSPNGTPTHCWVIEQVEHLELRLEPILEAERVLLHARQRLGRALWRERIDLFRPILHLGIRVLIALLPLLLVPLVLLLVLARRAQERGDDALRQGPAARLVVRQVSIAERSRHESRHVRRLGFCWRRRRCRSSSRGRGRRARRSEDGHAVLVERRGGGRGVLEVPDLAVVAPERGDLERLEVVGERAGEPGEVVLGQRLEEAVRVRVELRQRDLLRFFPLLAVVLRLRGAAAPRPGQAAAGPGSKGAVALLPLAFALALAPVLRGKVLVHLIGAHGVRTRRRRPPELRHECLWRQRRQRPGRVVRPKGRGAGSEEAAALVQRHVRAALDSAKRERVYWVCEHKVDDLMAEERAAMLHSPSQTRLTRTTA